MYRSKPKIQPPLYSDLPPTGPEIARAKSLMQDGGGREAYAPRMSGTRGLRALASLVGKKRTETLL